MVEITTCGQATDWRHMWKKFWKWITASSKREPAKGHPDLCPIDVGALAVELRLAEEAARLGAAGLPAPDALTISGPEAAIVQRVEKARQDYIDWAVLRLNVLNHDMARRDITRDVNRAKEAANDFEQKASAMLNEHDSLLSTLAENAASKKAELHVFRKEHGLTRNARYPSGGATYLLLGLLAVLVLVEAGLNATFFAQGMETGLIGGFTVAAILAGGNVIVSFLLGKSLVRYVNHVKAGWKILGASAVVFSIVWMTMVGLGIAHYRDALTADRQVPAEAALATLLQNPFHLQDVFSWTLFAISVFFATVSILDGLYSDDLYPGYGAVSRIARNAADDYEDELALVREQLEELKDEELSNLEDIIKRVQGASMNFGSLVEDKRAAGSRLSTALRDADHSLEALLRMFRTENELHRNGVHRPAYFDRLPPLQSLRLPEFDTAADREALAMQKAMTAGLLAEVEQIRARIQGAFSQKFDRLRPLDEHFLERKAA